MKTLTLLFLVFFSNISTSQEGWYKLNIPTVEHLSDISFANEKFGFVVGYNGGVFRTFDGGKSWEIINMYEKINLLSGGFYSVSFFNDSTILLSGQANLLINNDTIYRAIFIKSTDKGINWSYVDFPKYGVIDICKCAINTGFAFTTRGFSAMTTNAGLTWKDTMNLNNYLLFEGNYFDCWNDTSFIALRIAPNTTVGELPGYNNILTKKPGVYENWFSNKMLSLDTLDVRNVVAIGKGKFFVLAKDSLYWSFNEGKSWIRKPRDIIKEYWWAYAFKFYDELKGYMDEYWSKGNYHKIFHTTDGGFSWSEQYVNIDGQFGKINSFSVVNDSVAFACGWNGTVIKTTNGGRFPTSVKDEIQNELSFYPNPVDKYLILNTNRYVEKIEIYSIYGTKLIDTEFKESINVSFLPEGFYFLKVFAKNSTETKKFLIIR